MRGASALDGWLSAHADVDAFVVWEPVLDSDQGPPPERQWVAHAHNYWDAAHAISQAMKHSGATPACLSAGDADEDVVWDAVFVYDAGARWAQAPPATTRCGRTILRALPSLR